MLTYSSRRARTHGGNYIVDDEGDSKNNNENNNHSNNRSNNHSINPNNSHIENWKAEFQLLWKSLRGDFIQEKSKDLTDDVFLDEISGLKPEHLKNLLKELSHARKELNRTLERINKEIDTNSAKLESLRLVGAREGVAIGRISELNELGQKISFELNEIDDKLRAIRGQEEILYEAAK